MTKKLRKGFTLIELLVVIGIIALLLAILLPSLGKAKERAKQTVCKANLKGTGIAIRLYLNDYDDRTYIYTVYNAGNGYGWLDPATGLEQNPDTRDTYWGLVYNDYTKTPKIFSCPSFARFRIDMGVYFPEYIMDDSKILGGYGINDFFQSADHGSMNVSKIRVPSTFIIAQDHVEPRPEAKRDGDMFYIRQGNTYNLPQYRENGVRVATYHGIFRHSKKSRLLDNPAGDPTRRTNILENPNGQSNTLWLDGSVSGMDETTGENVRRSWYTGE